MFATPRLVLIAALLGVLAIAGCSSEKEDAGGGASAEGACAESSDAKQQFDASWEKAQ